MKKISLIIITGVLVACSKNKDNSNSTPTPTALTRIKAQTSGALVRTYFYDVQGRAVKVDNNDGGKKEYEYPDGKVIRKYYNTNGDYQYSNIEELNAEGYTVRSTRNNQPTWEYLYTYNADKTLSKQIMKSNSIIVKDFFWNNGNLDSIRFSTQNGSWNYTELKTYYTDKPNALGDIVFGEEYWGKNSKNLLKSSFNRFPDGSTSIKDVYTYEHDNQSRVTKQTITSDNGNVYIALNTYN